MGKKRKGGKVKARAYEAAQSTPLRRTPTGSHLSHDAAMERTSWRLLDWGRYLDENAPVAISLLDEFVKSVVGKGIVTIPEPRREDNSIDTALGVLLLERWKRWGQRADVTGQLSWNEVQRQLCRAWPRDGEGFFQDVTGRNRGFPFGPGDTPYRVEILEAEMVPWDFNDDRRRYRQGIQHDSWNRPTNYAVYKRHPGDMGMRGGAMVSFEDLKIVSADIMHHILNTQRWPATRGVSLLHGVIATLYDVKDLEESERIKNRNLSNWVAAIVKSPDLIGADDSDDSGNRYMETFQGMIIDSLSAGETIQGVGPDYPVANMPDHINDQLRRICGGTGTKHSAVSRRFDGNYAAQRQELVESVGYSEMRQDSFVSHVCRPVYEAWATAELLAGEVMLPRGMTLERAVRAEYRGPAIPWIDPLKEVQADIAAIDAGIADIDQIRIKRGAPEHLIGAPRPQPASPEPRQLSLINDEEAA